jgi:hypothetical protein
MIMILMNVLRNNEKDKGNEASFSLHDTSVNCLF